MADKLFQVEKVTHNRQTEGIKCLVKGKWYFWPSQLQVVPLDTQESYVYGQDGNIDYVKKRTGARHSSPEFHLLTSSFNLM